MTSAPWVVLVGAPGAGKTVVGAELARRRGAPHVDTDALVERNADKPVSEIFVSDGEGVFRALERAAVRAALGIPGAVVSTGGGSVLDPETRTLLATCDVVWLKVSLATAAPRVGLDAPRPLLAIQPRVAWRTLMAEREPLYAEVATHAVVTDGLSVTEVADRVEDLLR